MKDLIYYADLAKSILEDEKKYFHDKKIIKKIFELTSKNYDIHAIISRLTIIDSYYSTQMNKRYFGIEDIANKIWELYGNNEKKVETAFIEFAESPSNEIILSLFNDNYGIKKDGEEYGKAISLISKYAYFQTNFKFPIYDNLARKVLPKIFKLYFTNVKITMKSIENIKNYINAINIFKSNSRINDYNKIDNLLWLTGKIREGNLSLILKKDEYIDFVNTLKSKKIFEKEEINKDDKSSFVLKWSDLLKDEKIIEFCEFVRNIK
ncbi:MAG: hypothetical protein CVU05_06305 [Bacteroidetes bacterium HGW-Bacteroidetes-21]|jgi:hypothetical protein|nr:MAG: hypothetical protein CVU05_06305 [Bacteroidetes bacterium HGW-Bacteroidetes-21]